MRTNMNKNIFIYILFLLPMICISCDWIDESEKKENKEVKTIEVFPDSVRLYLIEQDSLKRGLISKIDTLTTELNASKNEIEQLQSEITQLKSPSRFFAGIALLSLLISIVALIISIRMINKKVSRWEVEDLTRHLLKDLEYRMNRAENNIRDIGKQSSKSNHNDGYSDRKLMDLEMRVRRMEDSGNTNPIETRVKRVENSGNTNPMSTSSTTPKPHLDFETRTTKVGYANINTGKYFTKILDSSQETCVFSIKFINETKGEFTIISLDKIKSRNGWQEVVEYTGSIEEATGFKEVDKGICEKVEDSTWQVIKPLKIKLTN